MSALGAITGANATAANASYQAQVAKNNATIADQNAVYATQAGVANTTAAGLKAASQYGRLRAAQAANGVDINSASAVDVDVTQREMGNLDTNNVMQNAMMQAYGYRTQAASYTASSQLDQAEADQAPVQGALGALGDALGTAPKWAGFLSNASSPAADVTDPGSGQPFL
jgi:hypothetical protein